MNVVRVGWVATPTRLLPGIYRISLDARGVAFRRDDALEDVRVDVVFDDLEGCCVDEARRNRTALLALLPRLHDRLRQQGWSFAACRRDVQVRRVCPDDAAWSLNDANELTNLPALGLATLFALVLQLGLGARVRVCVDDAERATMALWQADGSFGRVDVTTSIALQPRDVASWTTRMTRALSVGDVIERSASGDDGSLALWRVVGVMETGFQVQKLARPFRGGTTISFLDEDWRLVCWDRSAKATFQRLSEYLRHEMRAAAL